ncbi:hypothetical protein FOZ61_001869 [Perkinsus olseni]|uniref:Uncharacterized protein n=1 Tax=Perkinsus olseni TaxID=32597 RepID=A0A7J6LWK9_PEROL|nr:hypothetical protein FOZ61_001869 [Perkinsus olseni]
MRNLPAAAACFALIVQNIHAATGSASGGKPKRKKWKIPSLKRLVSRGGKPKQDMEVVEGAVKEPSYTAVGYSGVLLDMTWFLTRHAEAYLGIGKNEVKKARPRRRETCSLSYTFSPAEGITTTNGQGGDGGIVVGGKVGMLASAPSKGECALDYLYSWDNELPGMNRINIYPNLCSVLPYTQILDSHLSCTERLRRWGRPGLLLALQQQRHEPLKEDDLVVDFARSLLTEGSANSSTSLAGHVRAIKEKARMNRPEFPDLEEAPVFIREYVHSLFKLVSYTCYPIIVNVGRDVLSITLRSVLPGKLELHELEIIGSRVWGINDFSKASADLLYRIQKGSRQVTGSYGTALCEEQLFEYAKTIEKLSMDDGRASKPTLPSTFSANEKKRKEQLKAVGALIYSILPWAKVSHIVYDVGAATATTPKKKKQKKEKREKRERKASTGSQGFGSLLRNFRCRSGKCEKAEEGGGESEVASSLTGILSQFFIEILMREEFFHQLLDGLPFSPWRNCSWPGRGPPRRETNTAVPRFPVDSPPRRRIRVITSKSGLDGDQTPSFAEIEEEQGTPAVRNAPAFEWQFISARNPLPSECARLPGMHAKLMKLFARSGGLSSNPLALSLMRSPLVAAVGLALTVPVVEAAMAAVLSAAQHSAAGSATAHTKRRKGNRSKRVRSVLRSLFCMGRKCEVRFCSRSKYAPIPSVSRPFRLCRVAIGVDDVNAKTKEQYRVWDRCSLSYTFPAGPSTTEEQSNLGGVVVHAKQLDRRGKPTPRRTALDLIYAWENGQYNNTTRMNVMLDVADIIPSRTSKKDLASIVGEDGLVGVATHVTGMLGEIRKTRLTEGDAEVVPAFIWSLAHDKLHKKGSYYCMCSPITFSTKKRTVAIRLGAADPTCKLKLHDIDIVGTQIWEKDDMPAKSVNQWRDVERRASRIEGEHSIAVCEAQLVEYGRTIQDYLDRLMDNTEKSILFEELNDGNRERLLKRAAELVYHSLL